MVRLDAVVVGGGLFGATIAKALRAQGRSVKVVDDRRPMSGSAPSACLMKPSWFSGLGKGVADAGLRMLSDLYGLQEIEFTIRPGGLRSKVYRVNPAAVLDLGDMHVQDTVSSIRYSDDSGPHGVGLARGGWLDADLVVVAAGIWCRELMQVPNLKALRGTAWRFPGEFQPTINVWAPYKQLVAFQERPGTIWCGDGSALKPESWTTEREHKSRVRCANFVEQPEELAQPMVGDRPYVQGAKPCLLEERESGIWLATGGAKSGTIAAGWAASRILEATS